jgi:hypothetical protein
MISRVQDLSCLCKFDPTSVCDKISGAITNMTDSAVPGLTDAIKTGNTSHLPLAAMHAVGSASGSDPAADILSGAQTRVGQHGSRIRSTSFSSCTCCYILYSSRKSVPFAYSSIAKITRQAASTSGSGRKHSQPIKASRT